MELDGIRSVREIATNLAIAPDDAAEFLAFAVSEGMVTGSFI